MWIYLITVKFCQESFVFFQAAAIFVLIQPSAMQYEFG